MAQACYIPQYKTASFKGVTFDATTAESDHGRRGAEGEFVFGEETAYADLGRKIRRFHLKARWVLNSHIEDATNFIRVIESPGPGTLVHPTRGAMQAGCKVAKVKDDILEGKGITTAELEFVEANSWFGAFQLGAQLIAVQLSPLLAAVGASFTSSFGITNLSFLAVPTLTSVAAAALRTMAEQMDAAVGLKQDPIIAAVRANIDLLSDDPFLLADADRTWNALSSIAAVIDRFATSPTAAIASFRRAANWAATYPVVIGDASPHADLLFAAVAISSAGYIARNSMQVPAATMQDALAQYDMVDTLLSNELIVARAKCDNCLFMALQQFQADTRSALLNRAYNSPAIVQYNFNRGLPSLVAAHEIYGDAKKFGLIELHNRFSSPFLLSGDVTAPRAA